MRDWKELCEWMENALAEQNAKNDGSKELLAQLREKKSIIQNKKRKVFYGYDFLLKSLSKR
jgi:hypothetical protein